MHLIPFTLAAFLAAATFSPGVKAEVVGVGERCGGFRVNPPTCATGLVCRNLAVLIPDLPGVCIDPNVISTISVPRGYSCDSKPRAGQRVCQDGLICAIVATSPSETEGICERPSEPSPTPTSTISQRGEECGGSVEFPKICAIGLYCQYPTPIDPTYEGPGKCAERVTSPSPTRTVAGPGERCGGFQINPPVCASGLQCMDLNPMIQDLPGVCIDPKVNSVVTVGDGYPCDGYPKPGQRICNSNFTCQFDSTNPPGSPGTCKRPMFPTSKTVVSQTTKSMIGDTTRPPYPSPTVIHVGAGERCGGMPNPMLPIQECAPGLVCKYPTPIMYDFPGTCVDPNIETTTPTKTQIVDTTRSPSPSPTVIYVGVGESCGGMQDPRKPYQVCSPKLVCKYPTPPMYDYPGTCIDPNVDSTITSIPTPTRTSTVNTATRSSSPSPTIVFVGVGQRCGGMPNPTMPPPRCSAGLVCKYPSPIMYDFPGICIDPKVNSTILVGQGIPCDDLPKPGQQICGNGLVCSKNPNPYPTEYPELKYTCEPVKTTTTKSPSPTSTGTCVKKYNQCGGLMWKSKGECCQGTSCKYNNEYYSQCL